MENSVGLTYVALSRVKRPNHLLIEHSQRVDWTTSQRCKNSRKRTTTSVSDSTNLMSTEVTPRTLPTDHSRRNRTGAQPSLMKTNSASWDYKQDRTHTISFNTGYTPTPLSLTQTGLFSNISINNNKHSKSKLFFYLGEMRLGDAGRDG
jgi:hypothetical protein